ncbi:hypothetical protein [Bradyrhizobium sp. LA7.1]|uniref:hypothetical protein n=1 Tax=Bradyrhizobium sp. LA7.1 TaxID=3156324 RepID=UPI003391C590
MKQRLFICVGLIASLVLIANLAMQPGYHFSTDMEEFRKKCGGDEECAQRLEAQRRINSDDEINRAVKEAIAREDESRRQSRSK